MITLKPLFGYLAYHGITKKELAEKSGVSYITICSMAKTNEFYTSAIDKICLALNLNIKDIMRYDPD